MGTGIVSTALSLDGQETLSRILLAVAAVLLAAVAVALATLLLRDRRSLRESTRTPASLTWVAAVNVVGARLSALGWQHEAAGCLAVAAALWLVLVPSVLRRWETPTVGLSFLLAVATESVAVLAARLAVEGGAHWLAYPALAAFGLGLVFYLLVAGRFELRHLSIGRGDQWIAGGALAIAALACARATEAADAVRSLHGSAGVLGAAAFAIWVAALAWLPVLLVAEVLERRLTYDLERWSTVFPLGMYAVCSFADGGVRHLEALQSFARGWIWVAFAVWALVAAGSVRDAAARARAGLPPRAPGGRRR
jgi:tellurite resistance protein TehA-like permease